MPWTGPDPYGTAGGSDSDTLPLSPADIRTYRGRSAILFLQRNGPLTTVPRSSVEDIVRTLDAGGGSVVRFRIRDDGQILDDNVFDWEISDLTVSHTGSGRDALAMGTNIITNDKIADGAIITRHINAAAVTPAKLSQTYRVAPVHDFPTLFYDQNILDGSVLTPLNVGTFTWQTPTNAIVIPSENMNYFAEMQAQVFLVGAAGSTIADATFLLNGAAFTYGRQLTALAATGAQTLKPVQAVGPMLPGANIGGIVRLQHLTAADNIQSLRIKIRAYPLLGGMSWP